MSGFEEEPYSTIFTSLKHPVRRKILRMLSGKPKNFSEILGALGVSSSHLTYHLENLGELVSKTEDGKYRLSTFGEAAVGTMSKVEEAPKATKPERLSLSRKWKSFLLLLMIGLVVLAGVCYVQYQALNRLPAVENLSVEYYLSTIAPTAISPPISKPEAIYLALEYGRWNKTTLKDMVVAAHLRYVKFFHKGHEWLDEVTEPVSDYSPVHVDRETYRYVWVVGTQRVGARGLVYSIPPPGYTLCYVDAATGEVIPNSLYSRVW